MSFLFAKNRPKTPQETVYALKEWLSGLNSGSGSSQERDTAREEVARLLAHLRKLLSPNEGNAIEPDAFAGMAKEVYSTDVLLNLVTHLPDLLFDARKDACALWGCMLKRPPTVEYLLRRPATWDLLLGLAGNPDVFRSVGNILRDCAKHEALVARVMECQQFWYFFQYIDSAEFELATDNFSTFQDYLKTFPDLTTLFLSRHGDYFTKCMNGLLRSPNYVAKRQSLRLQYHLIRQQRNHPYMLRYIDDVDNLKLVMRLLKDKSKNIHYEAFQLFKLFVVNPKKSPKIYGILARNKGKLLDVLEKLQGGADRKDDDIFNDEREFILRKIRQLPDAPPSGRSSPEHSDPPQPRKTPQVPSLLNLGQAPPVLSHQNVPDIAPQK